MRSRVSNTEMQQVSQELCPQFLVTSVPLRYVAMRAFLMSSFLMIIVYLDTFESDGFNDGSLETVWCDTT